MSEQTPCERYGPFWAKRDDLFEVNGAPGGKARTCLALARGAEGLVTAGSRHSPQVDIVARVAQHLGIPARCHVPQGKDTPELAAAAELGAEVVRHPAGYNNVIIARAREDAEQRGWQEIPFGMECQEAVEQTRRQVRSLAPWVVNREGGRLVVPVGSGMSLAGILWGLHDNDWDPPVLGIVVGAAPGKRLARYAPVGWDWWGQVRLEPAGIGYHQEAPETSLLRTLELDPIYEAKCIPFLEPGDCLWVVGIRASRAAAYAAGDDAGRGPVVARGAASPPAMQRGGPGSGGPAQVAGAQAGEPATS